MPTELIVIQAIKVIHFNGCNGVGGGFFPGEATECERRKKFEIWPLYHPNDLSVAACPLPIYTVHFDE